MKIKSIFSGALAFCSSIIYSQSGTLTGFTITPSNPTVNDNVTVLVGTSFSYGSCDLVSKSYSVTGNDIISSSQHCVGMLTYICESVDTINLGQLTAGNKTFVHSLFSGSYNLGNPSSCVANAIADDIDTLSFSVSQACTYTPTIVQGNIMGLCPNTTSTLQTQVYDSYQWYKNGIVMNGETSQVLLISNADAGNYYSVQVSLNGCSRFTNSILVDNLNTVLPHPQAGFFGQSYPTVNGVTRLCVGDTAKLILTYGMINENPTNITWYKNGVIIPNETNDTLILYSNIATQIDYYTSDNGSSSCPSSTVSLGSNIAVMFVNDSTCRPTYTTYIKNIQKEISVTIYPNPTQTEWNLLLDNAPLNLQVSDISGKLIWESENKNAEKAISIASEGLNEGIYFLKVTTHDGILVKKLIKR